METPPAPLPDLLPDFRFYLEEMDTPWVLGVIARNKDKVKQLIKKHEKNPSFAFVLELDDLLEEVNKIWGVINHLNNVVSSAKIREIHQATLRKFNDFNVFIQQHSKIYHLCQEISRSQASLTPEQKRLVVKRIEDFQLSGVDLAHEDKRKYKKISQDLAKLNKQFADNVLDETDDYFLEVGDPEGLAGLTETSIKQAKAEAERRKLGENSWAFTLHHPSFVPFMKNSKREDLRRKMYEALVTRASKGKRNNSEIIKKILDLRHRQAKLLGFKNHCVRKLKNRMAKSPATVLRFLKDLFKKSSPQAERERQKIMELKRRQVSTSQGSVPPSVPFYLWDYSYYSERLKEEKYAYNEEKIKEYFPYREVMDGLFGLINKLFHCRFEKADNPNLWHEEVEFYNLYDRKDRLIGHLYLDLFARAGKRGGAWMDEYAARKDHSLTEKQLPIAYLNTNFAPPSQGVSLLTHYDVVVLLHEMGHVLHHLLTKVDYLPFSGINGVPWDGVELPSQFLENWAWEEGGLAYLSCHYKTKEPLPRSDFQIIKKSKNYNSALNMVRQLNYALIDMNLHLEFPEKSEQPHEIVASTNRKFSLFEPLPMDRFENSFTHIFGGGYSSGYYSYKWAEVLAADAFSMFKRSGLFNRKWADAFLENILEKGGSEDFMKLYVRFRGQKPESDALLKSLAIKAK